MKRFFILHSELDVGDVTGISKAPDAPMKLQRFKRSNDFFFSMLVALYWFAVGDFSLVDCCECLLSIKTVV